MYSVYYLKTGGIHSITDEEFAEIKTFYKFHRLANGLYANGRGDIFAWEQEKKII